MDTKTFACEVLIKSKPEEHFERHKKIEPKKILRLNKSNVISVYEPLDKKPILNPFSQLMKKKTLMFVIQVCRIKIQKSLKTREIFNQNK